MAPRMMSAGDRGSARRAREATELCLRYHWKEIKSRQRQRLRGRLRGINQELYSETSFVQNSYNSLKICSYVEGSSFHLMLPNSLLANTGHRFMLTCIHVIVVNSPVWQQMIYNRIIICVPFVVWPNSVYQFTPSLEDGCISCHIHQVYKSDRLLCF